MKISCITITKDFFLYLDCLRSASVAFPSSITTSLRRYQGLNVQNELITLFCIITSCFLLIILWDNSTPQISSNKDLSINTKIEIKGIIISCILIYLLVKWLYLLSKRTVSVTGDVKTYDYFLFIRNSHIPGADSWKKKISFK